MTSFRNLRPRPSLPDTDVFGVTRGTAANGATVFLVTHYPTRSAEVACCHVAIVQRPGESDVDALRRAAAAIAEHVQHAWEASA